MSESRPSREEIIRRLQQTGAPSVKAMAQETGIPKATLYCWLSHSTAVGPEYPSSSKRNPGMRKRSKPRSPSVKLRLFSESLSLTGDAFRTWCKQKGITMDELLGLRDLALSGSRVCYRA